MRDHTKHRAFLLAENRLQSTQPVVTISESKLIESEKVLGTLIRSLRRPNRLQSKQPEFFIIRRR